MIEPIQVVVLAIIQGLTEFLPISSSAHLILVPSVLGWDDQGLGFDVAVHVGTLLAVLIYFRFEIKRMLRDWCKNVFFNKPSTIESQMLWAILFATIPVGLAGITLKSAIEMNFRTPVVLAYATILFGVLLFVADVFGKKRRSESSIDIRDIIIIGCSQVLALIPGTSRSGITITAGLMAGLSRQAAARFSFLLSIPVILLAGGLSVYEFAKNSHVIDIKSISLGLGISFICAYLCISLFLKMVNSIGMLPFVIYRIVLGVAILFVLA